MNTIIVIDRQFGSGGREIAQRIAEKRQIPFYDRKLLERTAKESGFTETLVETQDEKPGNSIIFGLIADTFTDMPIEQDIFYAQQETIRSIARESKKRLRHCRPLRGRSAPQAHKHAQHLYPCPGVVPHGACTAGKGR